LFPRISPHDKNPVSKFSYWHFAPRFGGEKREKERQDDFYLKKFLFSGLPRIITRLCSGRNFDKSAKLKKFFFSSKKYSYCKRFLQVESHQHDVIVLTSEMRQFYINRLQ
jgi:hypothetical protein